MEPDTDIVIDSEDRRQAAERLAPLLVQHLARLACPACGGALAVALPATLACAACPRTFASEAGIARLFHPNEWRGREDVTERVRGFYEETPFPNYDDLESAESLRAKARSGALARLLDEQIPPGAFVLEAGCGTGQLSNFLGLTPGRAVFGTDLCLSSLGLAREFQVRNGIDGVAFLQMNLFRPAFRPGSFHFVICNGVLHHTSDPRLGLETLVGLVAPGGYLALGLYNRWGRLWTDLRRALIGLGGERLAASLDPRLRGETLNEARRRAWFQDQYCHPHESKHTIGEVLGWFDRLGLEFTSGIPKPTAFDTFAAEERLFDRRPQPRGSALDHALVEAGLALRGGPEGGFFILIGRKKGEGLRG